MSFSVFVDSGWFYLISAAFSQIAFAVGFQSLNPGFGDSFGHPGVNERQNEDRTRTTERENENKRTKERHNENNSTTDDRT